jgi:hypothetical protein
MANTPPVAEQVKIAQTSAVKQILSDSSPEPDIESDDAEHTHHHPVQVLRM